MRKLPDITSNDADIPHGIEKDLRETELHIAEGVSLQDERIKALIEEDRAMRAFMENKVTFSIAPSHDSKDEDIISCGVNGIIKKFKRGEVYTVERKFIDSLIKSVMKVRTINYKDENGIDQTTIKTHYSLVYPIQIHHDPAGDQGRRWFIHQQNNAY